MARLRAVCSRVLQLQVHGSPSASHTRVLPIGKICVHPYALPLPVTSVGVLVTAFPSLTSHGYRFCHSCAGSVGAITVVGPILHSQIQSCWIWGLSNPKAVSPSLTPFFSVHFRSVQPRLEHSDSVCRIARGQPVTTQKKNRTIFNFYDPTLVLPYAPFQLHGTSNTVVSRTSWRQQHLIRHL